jgi:hypothetical protein
MTGQTGQTGPTGPTGTNLSPLTNQFSVETGNTQSLAFSPSGAIATTITGWVVNSSLGDYNQGLGLSLASGVYTVPVTGLYHVLANVSVLYTPTNGTNSYNSQGTPMSLQFYLYGSSTTTLLSANFFSNSYAGVGGASNLTSLTTGAGATLAGDLSLIGGASYALQVINPFIDTTEVDILSGGPSASSVYCRWSMRQFA